ncbi:Com family DNA-binding transcriptional regulator [Kingella denitrificans]|uniref:Com family DNA-binding transcriptional regulator n=1 Tax=Kingella denitrificans TaxID=502 RepID=UPI000B98FF09|nr:Com family DNA-binding transcriptional regulator [Kingella denitrificans]
MQLRCKNTACNKLLAVGSGDIQIKCPRCKQISQFKYLSTTNAQRIPPAKGLHGCSKPQPTPNH